MAANMMASVKVPSSTMAAYTLRKTIISRPKMYSLYVYKEKENNTIWRTRALKEWKLMCYI